MSFAFVSHYNAFALWPSLMLAAGKCPSEECEAFHYSATVSFLFYSFNITV